jgi:hypothetical protein
MTGAVGRCCDYRAMRRPATLAALVIATAIALSPPVSADPTADPGDVQTLAPPRPSQAALDARFIALVEQIPGMHVIDPTITDNGGRMVCAHLDSHSREDTTADLLHDNPSFTPVEADAFVDDAEQVYCPAHIRQVIG